MKRKREVDGIEIYEIKETNYKKEDATVSDVYVNGLIDGYFMSSLPEEE